MTEQGCIQKREAGRCGAVEMRPASLCDLDVIMSIERASFQTPWSRLAMAVEMTGRSWSRVVSATIDGQVVGFMVYWLVVSEIHLLNIAVDPKWRRFGVASAMMKHLRAEGAANSFSEILLEVRVSNHAARSLYERFDFEQISVRPKYYADSGEDALLMLLSL